MNQIHELFEREIVYGLEPGVIAGVIDQAVQATVQLDGPVNNAANIRGLGNIGCLKVARARPFPRQFRSQRLARLYAASANDDAGPGIHKYPSTSFTDSL